MYLQSQFEETRVDVLHELVRAHPLAAFVAVVDGEITVEHMPFLLSAEAAPYGVLRSHIPRGNPVRHALTGELEAVAIFQGPEAYVTPSWYPSKREHGRVVPTWNYAVVHARGCPRIVDDAGWLRDHLTALTDSQESGETSPWKVSDAPEEFTERMIARLVGVEMPIESMTGKWKVSQNRPENDRKGVADGLAQDKGNAEMASLVRRFGGLDS